MYNWFQYLLTCFSASINTYQFFSLYCTTRAINFVVLWRICHGSTGRRTVLGSLSLLLPRSSQSRFFPSKLSFKTTFLPLCYFHWWLQFHMHHIFIHIFIFIIRWFVDGFEGPAVMRYLFLLFVKLWFQFPMLLKYCRCLNQQ